MTFWPPPGLMVGRSSPEEGLLEPQVSGLWQLKSLGNPMAKQENYRKGSGVTSCQADNTKDLECTRFCRLNHISITMQIRYVTGDLFSCPPTDSIAHCISADCRMGAGIAVQFRKRFKRVDDLKKQNKKKGDVAILEVEGRYIYYLITKDRAYGKPTYEDLQKSLEAMKNHAVCNNVTALSMPRIGCGLDRLQWDKVSCILKEVFRDTNISMTVYSL
ncbi:ADP-ribose glycohydrolase OARD1 [Pelodytes ibericus]